jgi:hypothetical protein
VHNAGVPMTPTATPTGYPTWKPAHTPTTEPIYAEHPDAEPSDVTRRALTQTGVEMKSPK